MPNDRSHSIPKTNSDKIIFWVFSRNTTTMDGVTKRGSMFYTVSRWHHKGPTRSALWEIVCWVFSSIIHAYNISTLLTDMATPGRYPRKVSVDFRKLEEKSLWNYISLHNIDLEGEVRPSKEELEIICAEHFAQWDVDEEKVLESWISHMNTDRDVRELGAVKKRNRSEFSPYGPYGHGEAPAFGGRKGLGGVIGGGHGDLEGSAGRIVPTGEQVAAKVTNTNENGSWILAEIIRYLAGRGCYEVKDADDPMKCVEVPADSVIRLTDGGKGFAKGDNVLAVFPDTTSFYRATISKQPVRKAGVVSELVVQFEDDADQETGKTPHRRINSKLVLAEPDGPYYDDYHNDESSMSHQQPGMDVLYDDHRHSHHDMPSSRSWNEDRHRRGTSGGSGGGGYDDEVYYGDEGSVGGGGNGGGWDEDIPRPPKAKRRLMGGGGRGMGTGFRS